MPSPHTQINLDDVEDVAQGYGFGDRWEARRASVPLDAEQTGITHLRLHPGKRSPFSHRHKEAEEIYVVMSGAGWAKLDDDVFEVRPRDAIRIAPPVARAFEAGPDGLEILAFGPPYEGDAEPVDDAWVA